MHRTDAHHLNKALDMGYAPVELPVEIEDLVGQPEAEMIGRQHVIMPAERVQVELPGELRRASVFRGVEQQHAGLSAAVTLSGFEIMRADAVNRNELALAHQAIALAFSTTVRGKSLICGYTSLANSVMLETVRL